jgi:hypothetical protein
MNYGKLAMLHRLSGCRPIVVYAGEEIHVRKLYDYLQELCCHSRDLEWTAGAVVTGNPLLAYHLREVVARQSIVPPSDESGPGVGTVIL